MVTVKPATELEILTVELWPDEVVATNLKIGDEIHLNRYRLIDTQNAWKSFYSQLMSTCCVKYADDPAHRSAGTAPYKIIDEVIDPFTLHKYFLVVPVQEA
jgi:hypothetical protein